MIEFQNGGRVLHSVSELPCQFIGARKIYLDFETTSGNYSEMSVNPWHNCDIAGFGITVDDANFAIYLSWMHLSEADKVVAGQWLQDVIWEATLWINHNVKYDAHVAINYAQIQLPPWLELKCTLTSAKLIDSDRNGARGGYSLDKLAKAWLDEDISDYEKSLQVYLGRSNKDYGRIPADILGEYCCQDVLTNRRLEQYIDSRLPERCKRVANTELQLTKELVKLEQYGMHFNPVDLKIAQYATLNKMFKLEEELEKLVGRSFRPAVNTDCNEVLCGQYGLPVLSFTKDSDGDETENASFDKKALAKYKALPYAPQEVIGKIIEYRKLSQRNNLFLEPWGGLAIEGVLHPNYNQLVRTGRMSCSEPNAQQLDDFMAALIIPRAGNSIISTDASQIEFRMITHYIGDKAAIASYNEDADTDFHQLVADLCGIGRKPAKTINFGTAFGEGTKKVIEQLSMNDDIVAAVKAEVDAMNLSTDSQRSTEFDRRVAARGKQVYETYHKTFPTLKSTAKAAESMCKSMDRRLGLALDNAHYYGYITDLYGRDRHLPYCSYRTDYKTKDPYDKAWLAFPTINQASAADLMKEQFVYLMRNVIADLPIKPIAIVHDELVFECPTELANDPRTIRDIVAVLESPDIEISVPIRWSIGVSDKNWLDAATGIKDGGKAGMLNYRKCDVQALDWAI